MKIVETNLVGQEFPFDLLDSVLHEIGFNRGSMFEYDWAAYDYTLKSSKIDEYMYLRIFTRAIAGVIERSHCTVMISDVFITGARYHEGLDYNKEIDRNSIDRSRELVREVANRLEVTEKVEVNMRDASAADCEVRSGVRPV
jgi:citrate lyase gamma subunit